MVLVPALLTVLSPTTWGLFAWIFGATFGWLLGTAAVRARMARRAMGAGCREVYAVGWTRVPDGVNYAVFSPGADPEAAEPQLVLRLPAHDHERSALLRLDEALPARRFGAVRPRRRTAGVRPSARPSKRAEGMGSTDRLKLSRRTDRGHKG
jgi:hypothetical protein